MSEGGSICDIDREIDRSDRAKQAERKCLFRSAGVFSVEQSLSIALVTRRSKGESSVIFVALPTWCFARRKIARAIENDAVRESVFE